MLLMKNASTREETEQGKEKKKMARAGYVGRVRQKPVTGEKKKIGLIKHEWSTWLKIAHVYVLYAV